jgi:hypothetical protein
LLAADQALLDDRALNVVDAMPTAAEPMIPAAPTRKIVPSWVPALARAPIAASPSALAAYMVTE